MDGLVDLLARIPAGVWTLVVALLGFWFGWQKDRQARGERSEERVERQQLRDSSDAKDAAAVAREDARYWRDRQVAFLTDMIAEAQWFVSQCVLLGERTPSKAQFEELLAALRRLERHQTAVQILCGRALQDEVVKTSLFAWQTFGDVDLRQRSGAALPDWEAWPNLRNLDDSVTRLVELSANELGSPASVPDDSRPRGVHAPGQPS